MARRKRHRLGQVFLVDRRIQERIAEVAAVEPGAWVMEVGPGLGHLTQALLERGARVIAVEVDRELAAFLRERYPLHMGFSLFLVEGDFLRMDLRETLDSLGATPPLKLVANIPYYITTPILEKIARHRDLFQEVVLTMQKEVAQRAVARPGTREWGALSVFLQYHFEVTWVFGIPRRFFRPVPRVDSALIRLVPHRTPPVHVEDERVFFRLVRGVFQSRRKTLRRTLQSAFPDLDVDAFLQREDLDGGIRGETLRLEDLADLANRIHRNLLARNPEPS